MTEAAMATPSYDTIRFPVSVFDDDLEKARALAIEKKVSVSVILRDAIKAGLEATKGKN